MHKYSNLILIYHVVIESNHVSKSKERETEKYQYFSNLN